MHSVFGIVSFQAGKWNERKREKMREEERKKKKKSLPILDDANPNQGVITRS